MFLNVGTGNDCTVEKLAKNVAEAIHFGGEIKWDASKPDGTPKKQLDVSRLAFIGLDCIVYLWKTVSASTVEFINEVKSSIARLIRL